MSSEETKRNEKTFDFHGSWMPSADPLLIGGKNFCSLSNQIPDTNGLCGTPGYTKTVTNILSTYLRARSGIQLRTKDSVLSNIFVQALNAAGTASAIMQQLADATGEDVPNVKDFESTPVHVDAAGAGLGRFSKWPQNQIAYCNGVESLVYGGPEMPIGKFITCLGAASDPLVEPIDYTDAMNNNLQTTGNVVTLGSTLTWTILTRRPAQAFNYSIKTANASTGQAVTGKYWNGTTYATLTITDNTSGLRVSGTTTFASTATTAVPKMINGDFFYVYQFTLSAGSAVVYRVTVDQPWQPVRDLWDGVLRPIIRCTNSIGGTIQDQTPDISDLTPVGVSDETYYTMGLGGMSAGVWLALATSERACAFKITMYDKVTGKVNTNASVVSVHCFNGATFSAASGLSDGTSVSGKCFAQSGFISWAPPAVEYPRTENDQCLWRYVIYVTNTLSSSVIIDMIEAVPAPQLTNLAYKFPMMLQNRAMLCNLTSTGEGNRIDFPVSGSTEGWNGTDSSNGDGTAPIYIGDQEDLTCGCEIFNRLGQSIYTFGLFFKANATHILNGYDPETYREYQINNKIGCPAPETLDTYTIEATKELQNSRSIAAWLSFNGPYMFDSAGLTYLPGLECYFDRNDSRCINFAAIEASRGWFDAELPQYNLQIPSGAGQTTNNVWFVYDFHENKWYPKIPSCTSPYLGAVVRVTDATKKPYIYGFRENGYVMRLEYGTTWDGSAIAQHIETGEILDTDNLWWIIKNTLLKLIYIPTTEAGITITVTLYKDGAAAGTDIAVIAMTAAAGGPRFIKVNKNVTPLDCWSYRLRFATSTSATPKGMQLLAWGMKYQEERRDILVT